jgi:hypothetical protein
VRNDDFMNAYRQDPMRIEPNKYGLYDRYSSGRIKSFEDNNPSNYYLAGSVSANLQMNYENKPKDGLISFHNGKADENYRVSPMSQPDYKVDMMERYGAPIAPFRSKHNMPDSYSPSRYEGYNNLHQDLRDKYKNDPYSRLNCSPKNKARVNSKNRFDNLTYDLSQNRDKNFGSHPYESHMYQGNEQKGYPTFPGGYMNASKKQFPYEPKFEEDYNRISPTRYSGLQDHRTNRSQYLPRDSERNVPPMGEPYGRPGTSKPSYDDSFKLNPLYNSVNRPMDIANIQTTPPKSREFGYTPKSYSGGVRGNFKLSKSEYGGRPPMSGINDRLYAPQASPPRVSESHYRQQINEFNHLAQKQGVTSENIRDKYRHAQGYQRTDYTPMGMDRNKMPPSPPPMGKGGNYESNREMAQSSGSSMMQRYSGRPISPTQHNPSSHMNHSRHGDLVTPAKPTAEPRGRGAFNMMITPEIGNKNRGWSFKASPDTKRHEPAASKTSMLDKMMRGPLRI